MKKSFIGHPQSMGQCNADILQAFSLVNTRSGGGVLCAPFSPIIFNYCVDWMLQHKIRSIHHPLSSKNDNNNPLRHGSSFYPMQHLLFSMTHVGKLNGAKVCFTRASLKMRSFDYLIARDNEIQGCWNRQDRPDRGTEVRFFLEDFGHSKST